MKIFILKRLLNFIPMLFLMSIIIFIIVTLPQGDPLTNYEQNLINEMKFSPEQAKFNTDALREWYGLDEPKIIQYFVWISRFIRGDLGYSLTYDQPVSEIIGERVFYSLLISTTALGFAWIIGIPLGVLSAIRRNSLQDHLSNFLGFLGLSIPNFFLALLLLSMLWFSFGIPPPSGLISQQFIDTSWNIPKILDLLKHLWLPVVVVGTAGVGQILRIMRGNLLDVLKEQFVTVARAKGLRERVIIVKHAVRIAINPLISLLGMQIPFILSGEILGSIVLNLPTLGPLLYNALLWEDYYVSGAVLMFMAVFLLVGNLVADIILAWIDPRIRFGK